MSEMTNQEADRVIAEAMGSWNTPPEHKIFQGAIDFAPTSSATDYHEAMAWAKEQDWFADFVTNSIRVTVNAIFKDLDTEDALDQLMRVSQEVTVSTARILLDKEKGSHALASYIEGREG